MLTAKPLLMQLLSAWFTVNQGEKRGSLNLEQTTVEDNSASYHTATVQQPSLSTNQLMTGNY